MILTVNFPLFQKWHECTAHITVWPPSQMMRPTRNNVMHVQHLPSVDNLGTKLYKDDYMLLPLFVSFVLFLWLSEFVFVRAHTCTHCLPTRSSTNVPSCPSRDWSHGTWLSGSPRGCSHFNMSRALVWQENPAIFSPVTAAPASSSDRHLVIKRIRKTEGAIKASGW